MIKVKYLENVQDDQSITFDKVSALIPQKISKTRKSLKASESLSKKNIERVQLSETSQMNGGTSVNSQTGLALNNGIEYKNMTALTYGELIQNNNKRKKLRQNGTQLKQIITQQKIKIIVKNFIQKIARNNTNSKPVQYSPFHNDMKINFMDTQGLELHDYFNIGIAMLSVAQIIVLSIIYTLSIVFEEVNKDPIVQAFQSFSLGFYLIEIGINFFTIKFEQGKKLSTLRDIWRYYLKDNFPIDFISMLILILDMFADFKVTIYFRLFIIVKLSQGLEKVQKLEIFFINNFYNQQYWNLIKVFLFNFSFAHILAIFLIAMADINENQNWMHYKDIYLAPWFQKYAWAYYWATTMMLTVGFGDLAATTYQQAMILTLVEMISCICLAYNINCVGTLISNIRSQDVQKSKNFKIFRKLARKNDVSEDLQWRINNYIEESSNIKKKFNHQEENFFVEKLPKGLKTEFLKESNKKIFHNLPFFKNLMERTLFSFAEKIQMHICHPEEIIQHIDDPHHLLILKGGEIGFACKKNGCDFNSTIIDQLRIINVSEPILVSLGFIRQNRPIYEIKSLEYSILYFLDHQMIEQILKTSQMDYELFCLLRDKCSHIPDQFQLFNCEICNGRHTKFTCPKIHFMPIKQQVANKYIHKCRTSKANRDCQFVRYQPENFNALKIFLDINHEQTRKSTMLKTKKSQNKNVNSLLSQRKKFEQIDEQSNTIIKQLTDIKDFFSRNAAQLIKNEMSKAFQYGQGHDEVWIIESDKMKNYKNYFEADNSCNLVDKFSLEKRNGIVEEVEDFWNDFRTKGNTTMDGRATGDRQPKLTNKTSFKTLKTLGVKFSANSQNTAQNSLNSGQQSLK